MKPQELTFDCELFDEFRRALNAAVKSCMQQMVAKRLSDGTITGKIEIHLEDGVDEAGEVVFYPEITPDVQMKIAAKGKIDCAKQAGFLMKCGPGGFVVGTDQVTMDELIEEQAEGVENDE